MYGQRPIGPIRQSQAFEANGNKNAIVTAISITSNIKICPIISVSQINSRDIDTNNMIKDSKKLSIAGPVAIIAEFIL